MFLFWFILCGYFTVHCTVILLYIYCPIAVHYTVLLLYIALLYCCTLHYSIAVHFNVILMLCCCTSYCKIAVHCTVLLQYIVFFYCLQLHYCTIVHWTRKINCNEYFIIFRSQRWFNMKVWFHIILTIVIKKWTNWRTCN